MKLNLKLGLVIVAGALAFTACKKNEPLKTEPVLQPNPQPGNTANMQDLKNFMIGNRSTAVQTFTIDEDAGQTITGAQGTTIQFFPNSFVTQAGAPVSGNIKIELLEVFSKTDMILMNAATMGRANDGSLKPLISGGEMRVTASQNGQILKLAPGMGFQSSMPASSIDPNMTLFYGEGGANPDTLIWNEVDSAQFQGQGSTYNFWSDSINWINCDYFYNNPNPQTIVQATPPSGFNNANLMLFVSFDGLNTIASLYGFSGGNFTTAPGYTLPIGLPVHFVAIAMIGNTPHVSIVPATITNNMIQTIPALTQMTSGQLTTALNALP